ncbi:MAG: FAD-dependent oxidoreductase [Nitrospiria bacterium]
MIVGAGAGGVVLALNLAKKGLQVALLDQKTTPSSLPRGEILQPNGLKILDQMGLLTKLLQEEIHVNKKVQFFRQSGDSLCTIDYTRLSSPFSYALILLPEVLQRLLLKQVSASSNITHFWGTTFSRILWKEGRVAGVEADHLGKSLVFHAPMVVGGDGVRSPLRKAFKIKHRLYSYADGYVTMVVDRPPGFSEDSHYYLGKRMIFGAFPVSEKKIYLFYLVPTTMLEKVKQNGIEAFKETILSLNSQMKSLFEKPVSEILSWEKTAYMRCFRVVCDRWVVNGGALIGDAAHAMNPHVAQGRNAAMEDALVLSGVIETCFEHGDFSRNKLQAYEAIRRSKIDILQGLGDEMNWLWNSGFAPLVWLRDRIFRSVQSKEDIHAKMLSIVSGLKVNPLSLYDRFRSLVKG